MDKLIEIASQYGLPGLMVVGIGWVYWRSQLHSNEREDSHRQERVAAGKAHADERKDWKELNIVLLNERRP